MQHDDVLGTTFQSNSLQYSPTITEVYRVYVNSSDGWTLLAFYDKVVLLPTPGNEGWNDTIVVISQISRVSTTCSTRLKVWSKM